MALRLAVGLAISSFIRCCVDINDKDSANAEQFQIASEDAKRKEVRCDLLKSLLVDPDTYCTSRCEQLKEQMRLWLVVHDDVVKSEGSIVQHKQLLKDVEEKKARIRRPAQVNPHVSLLNVSVKESKELPGAGPNEEMYVAVVIGNASDKTDPKKGVHPRFLKPMSFDVTTLDSREPLRFRVFRKRLLAQDELIGEAELPLNALNDFQPLDTWLPMNLPAPVSSAGSGGASRLRSNSHQTKPAGALGVTLWLIPRESVAIANHIYQLDQRSVLCRR